MKLVAESLYSKLLRQIFLMQLVVLLIVTVFSIFLMPRFDERDRVLDRSILKTVSDVLKHQGDRLVYDPTPQLKKVMAGYDRFWFYAIDEAGREGSYGPVPDGVSEFLSKYRDMTYASISWQDYSPDRSLIATLVKTPNDVTAVASGGGPSFNPFEERMLEVKRTFVLLLILLTMMTGFVVFVFLRREFHGVTRLAEEAEEINIDQRGTRLTETNVPRELQGMVRAVNLALTRVDEGLEKRQGFLAAAAHELRTPIAILMTRVETLPSGEDRDRLQLDVARLAALADQLLDLQRLESDHMRFERIDLREIVALVSAEIAPLAISAKAEISLDTPRQPVLIEADRLSLSRAITNLVQNAISYSGPGARIELEVLSPPELRVRDNGPGVPDDKKEQIFEPFYRGGQRSPGAGLGLNLVKRIVNHHKGRVIVIDAPAGGAEFIISFDPAT